MMTGNSRPVRVWGQVILEQREQINRNGTFLVLQALGKFFLSI